MKIACRHHDLNKHPNSTQKRKSIFSTFKIFLCSLEYINECKQWIFVQWYRDIIYRQYQLQFEYRTT